ncbi:hypothetical protein SK128_025883 [Halocaridina rubra]|uniref:Uncharacterized protein n=1 Tax=Halocaridina rubra TaxID=373956 RepID=A0AAN9A990_HALRR
MSVICQTFVQNTWRKDLCSNCFKSKEEHETERKSSVGGGSGIRETEGGNFSSIGLNRGLDGGVGGGSKRYLGVAGSVYQRSYYNRNSWNSMILDKTDSGLKSPGLIKGMSHLINQENEKNLKLSDMMDSEDSLRSSRLVQCVKASQSEAKLLTELLGDSVDDRQLQHEIKKEPDKPLKYFASRTNASPETSDNINSNAGSSSSSYETIFKTAQSNTTPSSNYNGVSDHIERDKEVMELTCDQVNDKEKDSSKTISFSILKHAGDSKSSKGSISFCSKLEEIIGYGGDVDYSDNEDTLNDDDDDDDDDDYDDFMDLTPDERVLRRLTEKNTEFNADNDNLKKDIEELLPSVKELEEKRKMIIAEIEELERLGKERSKDEKSKHPDEKKEEKPEGKVKLKRSPPLVSVKPLIARNKNEVRVNQVWPMKNGEIIRSGVSSDIEEVPLKGIKPKYVSREEEMIEKISCENETKTCATKITSVDEICISEYSKEEKVTSIDAICNSQNAKPERLTPIDYVCDLYANGTVKSDEICLIESSAITRMENLIQEQEPLKLSQEKNPEPLECKSVMLDMKREAEAFTITSERTDTYTSKNAESPHHGSQEAKLSITSSVSVGNSLHHVGKKDLDKKVPVSAPRKSLLSTLESSNKVLSALDPSDDAIAKVCHDCEIQKDTSDISNDSVLLSLKKSSVDRNYEQDHNDIFRDSEMVAINSIIDSESQVKEDTSLRNARDVTQKLNKSSFSSSDAVLSRQVPVNNEALEVPSSKDSLRLSYSFPNAKAFVAQSELESPRISEISKMSNGNSSNLFTTFGTPVTTSSSQNSFLYSPSSRSVYNDSNLQSPLYTPATTDFLKEIKSHPEVPKPTASIQKSALYASTSCLKGLPGGKPVITPKPPILKEKPKVPFKPAPSSSRIYSTPSQIISKPVVANIPFRASTPKPVGEDNIESKHNLVPNTSSFNAEGPFDSLCKVPQDKKKPPPTIHAPAIPAPSGAQKDEVLYDIPVTIASTQFISNVNNSSSCPTEATIYQEIDDQLGQNMLSEESSDSMMVTSNTSESLVSSKIGNVASPVIRSESSRCDSRSTFEANRSLVSAALELGSNSLKRCDGKRIAPQPPMEECISLLVEDVNNTITCGTSMNGDLQSQEGYSACMDNNDGESYSSFTDDFDDDEEEPEQRRIVSRKAERSSSAIPYYRNSIGNILTYEIQTIQG